MFYFIFKKTKIILYKFSLNLNFSTDFASEKKYETMTKVLIPANLTKG